MKKPAIPAEETLAKLERALAFLVRALEAAQRRRAYPLERAQYLLIELIEGEGPQTVGAAAARLLLDDSTATRQVAALVERGLVEKTVNPADGRSALISVLPKGSRQAAEMRAKRLERLEVLFKDWDEDERARCAETLRRLNHALAAYAASPPADDD